MTKLSLSSIARSRSIRISGLLIGIWGRTYQAKGQYAEAVAEYQKALASNDNPWVKAQLIRSLVKAGKRDEAVKLLGELQSDAARRVVSSASLALAYGCGR